MSVKNKTEKEVREFIAKGAEVNSDKPSKFCSMLQLRVPNCYLERIDEHIRENPHLNRTQWILDAIVNKLSEKA